MKKLILSTFLMAGIAFAGCNDSREETNEKSGNGETSDLVYSCPMHPDVTADKPGICPQCKMDLVQKEQ